MQIIPVGPLVTIQPDRPQTELASGLLIPSAYVVRPPSGLVLAVGSGVRTAKGRVVPPVKAGSRVMFNKNSGWRFRPQGDRMELLALDEEFEDQDILLVDWHDILCVMNEAVVEVQ